MPNIHYLRLSVLISLCFIALSLQPLVAQPFELFNTCAQADAGVEIDLSTLGSGRLLNYDIQTTPPIGIPNNNGGAPALGPSCSSAGDQPTVQVDRWIKLRVNLTGQLTFNFSPSEVEDYAIAVYKTTNGGCANLEDELLKCVNRFGNGITEGLSVPVKVDSSYLLRIMKLSNTTELAGNLTIYGGGQPNGDLYTQAPEVEIGDCNLPIKVQGNFFNSEAIPDPPCITAAIDDRRDSWFLIRDLLTTQTLRMDFTSENKNSVIAIYGGPLGFDGFSALPLECDAANATETATVFFSPPTNGDYYIRIMNDQDTKGMLGTLCVAQSLGRNICINAYNDPVRLRLGDCDVPFDVGAGFAADAGDLVAGDCVGAVVPPDPRTGFAVFEAEENGPIRLDYSVSSVPNGGAGLTVFDAGVQGATVATCNGILTEVACEPVFANAFGTAPNTTLTFNAQAGHAYFIRLTGLNGGNLFGTICIYRDGLDPAEEFPDAPEFNVDGSNCGDQFNVFPDVSVTSNNTESRNCEGTILPFENSAWASFRIDGTFPFPSVIVEYNNDNNSVTVANDAAIFVYQGEDPTDQNITGTNTCALGATLDIDQTTTLDIVNNTDLTIDLPATCDGSFPAISGDEWVTFTDAIGEDFTISYKNDNNDAIIQVFSDALGNNCATLTCADQVALVNNITGSESSEIVNITGSTAGRTYYIRIARVNPAVMTGKLSIVSLEQVACTDEVVEGVERITLVDDTQNPNYILNRRYYVEIVHPGSDPVFSDQETVSGTLCLRDGNVTPGDLCSTAFGLQVGDCDINLRMDNTFRFPQSNLPNNVCANPTVFKDAWVSFTATSSETSVEFATLEASPTQQPLVVVYRGSCENLIPVACEFISVNTIGVAQVKFASIEGAEYFAQIVNITGDNDMEGRICIFNVPERDFCDDQEIRSRLVGDCNIPFAVPASFALTGPETLRDITDGVVPAGVTVCDTDINNPGGTQTLDATFMRDSWLRVFGNGDEVTIVYENKSPLSDPLLLVYTSLENGTVDCGAGLNGVGNANNQIACANDADGVGIQTESVTFETLPGQQFILRVVDLVSNGDMEGSLCISSGRNDYDIPCQAREINIGDCSIPLNVISGNLSNCFNPPSSAGGDPCDDCTTGVNEGDAWATFTRPLVCNQDLMDTDAMIDYTDPAGPTCSDPVSGLPLEYWAGPDGLFGPTGGERDDDRCFCSQSTVLNTIADTVTIQYDNRDGTSSFNNADISLSVYSVAPGFDPNNLTQCNDPNEYTVVSCANDLTAAVNPADAEGIEQVQITGLDVNHGSGGETYYVRVINKAFQQTAFGRVCTFYGGDVADDCPPQDDYGALEGEFRTFEIRAANGPTDGTEASQQPTPTIPDCVIPGGSLPKTNEEFPIRAQNWMRFGVPEDAQFQEVTVQFDNAGFTPQRNTAIAVYASPNHRDGTGNVTCQAFPNDPDGLVLVADACANTVFVGTESVTVPVLPGDVYYVRVMNIHNEQDPGPVTGRIRVFPFGRCDFESSVELVTDGEFSGWPGINDNGTVADNQDPAQILNPILFDNNQNDDIFTNPTVADTDTYPNDLDQGLTSGVARFATDYGFAPDETNIGTTASATYTQLLTRNDELSAEGLYTVRQTPRTIKNDWYGYGRGFSGFGGRLTSGTPRRGYCQDGRGGFGTSACSEVLLDETDGNEERSTGIYNPEDGIGGSDRPSAIPTSSDANFMIVNGSFDPSSGLPPGKVWCQTIVRDDADLGNVDYFIFSVWVQNMISGGRDLDVPQLRMTVCDMEDPSSPGIIPKNIGTFTQTAADQIEADGLVTGTNLPGVTYASETPVVHRPIPPTNRLQDPRVDRSYGAATPCNLPNEQRDARLKILGSSFLINENPDNWRVVRCVYRAPPSTNLKAINICIENLSLTQNGNDFAIDAISFRKCNNPNVDALDRLLRGDPCELGAGPQLLDIPLSVGLLDFTGRLNGDRVLLDWLTANEQNVAYYEVQRSIDGVNFSKVGKVDALPQSADMNEYMFTDYELPNNQRFLYYRLKMHYDNSFTKIGPVIQIDASALENLDLKLIPNPTLAGDEVEVQFEVPVGNARISITNLMGIQMHSEIVETENGLNSVFIPTGNLEAGIYVVEVIHDQLGKKTAKRLVILR